MKNHFILSAIVAAGLLTGCSKQENTPAPASNSAPSASANAPAAAATAPATTSGARVVKIQAGDNMKFDVTSIEAKPGEELKIVLINVGVQPKDVMGHNWVLLKAGADAQAFATVAMTAKATDYIPDSLKDQIIVHTKLLGPNQTEEITFKAPSTPGDYPYLCSFPAHFLVGMKGVLVVK